MRINISHLASSAEEMADQEQKISAVTGNLREVQSALKLESSLEAYRQPLNRAIEQLEEERQELRQMVRVLEQVLTMYSRCEQRVLQRMEEGTEAAALHMTVVPKTIQFDADLFSV